jgi:ribonuclease-3
MNKKQSKSFEKKLGYTFKNTDFLHTALTHKTFAFEALKPIEYNERLEFLGDSIINFIIADRLYRTNTYFTEGELTRRRSLIVNNKHLAQQAKKLGIGPYLLLGKGEEKQDGRKNPTNLANALEALIAAVYLDSDLQTVIDVFSTRLFEDTLEKQS